MSIYVGAPMMIFNLLEHRNQIMKSDLHEYYRNVAVAISEDDRFKNKWYYFEQIEQNVKNCIGFYDEYFFEFRGKYVLRKKFPAHIHPGFDETYTEESRVAFIEILKKVAKEYAETIPVY